MFGATGATGKHLLRELLAVDSYSKVGEYGRSVSKTEQLPSTDKLEQKSIDFEKIEQEGIKDGNWDVVFITCMLAFTICQSIVRARTDA